jgi:hypothetical protein
MESVSVALQWRKKCISGVTTWQVVHSVTMMWQMISGVTMAWRVSVALQCVASGSVALQWCGK